MSDQTAPIPTSAVEHPQTEVPTKAPPPPSEPPLVPSLAVPPAADEPTHPSSPPRDEPKTCCCIPICASGPGSGPAPLPPETCTFNIYLSRVKVDQTSGDDPGGANEYTIEGSANGVSVVHPSATTWITIYKMQGWKTINRFITSVTLTKGSTKYVTCHASIIEWDMILNSSETGESQLVVMQLMCDQFIPPVSVLVDLHHLTNIPTLMGRAYVEFAAYQV